MRWPGRAGSIALGLVGVGLVGVVSGACGSSGATAAGGRVAAQVGAIEIMDPYLPEPSSPTVAAVYLTLRNNGSTSDALVGASSSIAATASLHTEVTEGSVEVMAPMRSLEVPAHGKAQLLPAHDHLMLQGVSRTLKAGDTVVITLRFAVAGSVAVNVPVVPLASVVAGMGNMPGMGGG